MTPTLERIISIDDWSDEHIDLLHTALQDDDLAEPVRRWVALSSQLGARLRGTLPDTEALVLFALSESDFASDLSEADRRAVEHARSSIEQALEQHPSVRKVLDRISEDAELFDAVWSSQGATDEAHHEQVARARDRRAVQRLAGRSGSPRIIPLVRPWMAAAAAVAAVIVSVLLFRSSPSESDLIVSVEPGITEQIPLPDGSTARLAGPASVRVHSENQRSISLSGSAFFDVAPGQTAFEVRTPNALTRVLGTSFALQSTESSTSVTLVTGRLEFSSLRSDTSPVELRPGQRSTVRGDSDPSHPTQTNLVEALRWTGLFVFRDTPLPEVAGTLSRDFDIQIDIADELSDKTLTGTFAKEQGASEILRVIAAAVGAELEISDDGTAFLITRARHGTENPVVETGS